MADILIHFTRQTSETFDKKNKPVKGGPARAWCKINRRGYATVSGAVLYKMIFILCKAGHEGKSFRAHDGIKDCLYGEIHPDFVPDDLWVGYEKTIEA